MIKKAFLILVAGLTAIEVFAQAPDTVSTVVGRKLNFEVPVFGITTRAFKPTWSVVAFEELATGVNYLSGAPEQLKSTGWYAALHLAGLQYRPGRNENVISVGLLEDVNVNRLQKGYSFADDGSIIATPSNWCNASSTWSENLMGLQIGYIREFGDWKAGVFVIRFRGVPFVSRQINHLDRYIPAGGCILLMSLFHILCIVLKHIFSHRFSFPNTVKEPICIDSLHLVSFFLCITDRRS